jgi:hypothetical protein
MLQCRSKILVIKSVHDITVQKAEMKFQGVSGYKQKNLKNVKLPKTETNLVVPSCQKYWKTNAVVVISSIGCSQVRSKL